MPWSFHSRASLMHVPRHALLAVVLGGHRPDDLLRRSGGSAPATRVGRQSGGNPRNASEIPGSRTLAQRAPLRLTDQSTNDRIAVAAKPPYRSLSWLAVRRPLVVPLVLTLLAVGGCSGLNEKKTSDGSAPQISAKSTDRSAATELGFPVSATKNTTRVAGADAAADVAGAVSAVFPSTSRHQPAARGRDRRRTRLAGGDRRLGADGQPARGAHAAERRGQAARGLERHARRASSQPAPTLAGRTRRSSASVTTSRGRAASRRRSFPAQTRT